MRPIRGKMVKQSLNETVVSKDKGFRKKQGLFAKMLDWIAKGSEKASKSGDLCGS